MADVLAWTYRLQRAHVVIGQGAGLFGCESRLDGVRLQGRSACGAAQMEAIGLYGARIAGGSMASGALHEDAEVVHAAVGRVAAAPLLIAHAVVGDCPDWLPGVVPRLEPVLDAPGRPRVVHEAWDRGRRYGWCLVASRVSQSRIDQQRAEYSAWWAGLAEVAADPALRRLKLWRVTGPAAKKFPWL